MGKVVYATGIDYVSGSLAKPTKRNGHNCGTYLIGTHREAETTSETCTRLYVRKADSYKRSTPVSAEELEARGRFESVSKAVAVRMKNLMTLSDDIAAFKAQKDSPTGKKTFKSYLWSVCGAEYDAQHGN